MHRRTGLQYRLFFILWLSVWGKWFNVMREGGIAEFILINSLQIHKCLPCALKRWAWIQPAPDKMMPSVLRPQRNVCPQWFHFSSWNQPICPLRFHTCLGLHLYSVKVYLCLSLEKSLSSVSFRSPGPRYSKMRERYVWNTACHYLLLLSDELELVHVIHFFYSLIGSPTFTLRTPCLETMLMGLK